MKKGPSDFSTTKVLPCNPDSSNGDFLRDQPDQPGDDKSTANSETSQPPRRRRGRPKGSKNRPKPVDPTVSPAALAKKLPNSESDQFGGLQHLMSEIKNINDLVIYLTAKEEEDRELAVKLRKEGVIKTPGEPFELSDDKEFTSLMQNGVFKLVKYDPKFHDKFRMYKARFVREIKGKGTTNPFGKARMVIAAWGDTEKTSILTQSPTLQRASQRLIAALAPSLLSIESKSFAVWH
ncbi:hypothetical protein K3495_g6159 [Podosphaera aphanis]|nr:hypothetical protein K3495_g6159 [Podosphaera aphanis]